MNSYDDSLLMRSLRKEPVSRTPVWLMRQAGRYLPEYRQTRAQAGDFMSLCRDTARACEVTLQPLRRFDLDAAILFSDILTIPDAMGLGLSFAEGEGPRFQNPVQTPAAIEALPELDAADSLAYVMDAVRLIRKEMPAHLPLIGFSGSPWTLACYMVEGRSSPSFQGFFDLIHRTPEAAHLLLDKLQRAVTDYLSAQVCAGANVLMIFDTWGGLLETGTYEAYSLSYMTNIVQSLKKRHPTTPVLLFTKGGGRWLSKMADSGCDGLGLDWTVDIGVARQEVGGRVALQGNFEPALLLSDAPTIRAEVKKILSQYGAGSGHIFNLGHGITPDVAPDNVAVLVEAVREFSPIYHRD